MTVFLSLTLCSPTLHLALFVLLLHAARTTTTHLRAPNSILLCCFLPDDLRTYSTLPTYLLALRLTSTLFFVVHLLLRIPLLTSFLLANYDYN